MKIADFILARLEEDRAAGRLSPLVVAALRAVVDVHQMSYATDGPSWQGQYCSCMEAEYDMTAGVCPTLYELAAAWSDHPDFDRTGNWPDPAWPEKVPGPYPVAVDEDGNFVLAHGPVGFVVERPARKPGELPPWATAHVAANPGAPGRADLGGIQVQVNVGTDDDPQWKDVGGIR